MMFKRLWLAAALFLLPALGAQAEDTNVDVHVIAKGAKFVGSSMGGVRILVKDAETGELLAKGVTAGSTGDTARIMKDSHDRKGTLWTKGAAEYAFTLDIDRPRKVKIEASGPLSQLQSMITVTSEYWIIPGKHITEGDALLIELPGFAVDILSPAAHSGVDGEVVIEANVVMMCGCPVTPGGLWDANGYEVTALIYQGDTKVATVPLSYAGVTSRFKGSFTPEISGPFEITVYAYDKANGNTGLDRTSIR